MMKNWGNTIFTISPSFFILQSGVYLCVELFGIRLSFCNYSGGTSILAKPPHRMTPLRCYLAVLQIRSFGTLKHTNAIREGQVSVDSEMDVVGVLLNSYIFFIVVFCYVIVSFLVFL